MAKSKPMGSSQKRSIEKALELHNKAFPEDVCMRYAEMDSIDIERFSSGSIALDNALGGGWPRGRVVEVFGEYSSAKTTVAQHAIAEVQKLGEEALFIDAEHASDPKYMKATGIDVDKLFLNQPSYGESALELLHSMINTGVFSLIVVDSVAALVPRAELEGNMGDSLPGLHARLMSQALKKITPAAQKNNCTVMFLNQVRKVIGVTYGSDSTTTGGKALPFYASIRVKMYGTKKNSEGVDIVSETKTAKIVKNKTAPAYKEASFDVRYGIGIDREKEVLDLAAELGHVTKGGAWYTVEGESIQGAAKATRYLRENKDVFESLLEKVRSGEFAESANVAQDEQE